jgi:hypothetical protein
VYDNRQISSIKDVRYCVRLETASCRLEATRPQAWITLTLWSCCVHWIVRSSLRCWLVSNSDVSDCIALVVAPACAIVELRYVLQLFFVR